MAALLGETLPAAMPPRGLPQGLLVAPEGPGWIEIAGSTLTYLGAAATLRTGPLPGTAVSDSAYMPVALQAHGTGIAGTIGHAPCSFAPVAPDAATPPAMAGLWRNARHNATLEVTADGIGGASAGLGTGPLHVAQPLIPLDATRALMPVGAPPWASRASLWLRDRDTLMLATQRSRMLDFERIA